MEKITMTITAETMDRAMEILARTTGRQFRELKVEYEALLVAEGKSWTIKSRPYNGTLDD